MNKRPIILRTVIFAIIIFVFFLEINPLTPLDFYKTFKSLLKNPDSPVAAKLISEAQAAQAEDSNMYPSIALLEAANKSGVELNSLVDAKGNKLEVNRDVISMIRQKASSSIRLGLDLNGGVEFLLELVPDEEWLKDTKELSKNASIEEAKKSFEKRFQYYRDLAIETLRARMETQKIFEAEISPAGGHYVSLKVPVVSNDEKLKLLELIKMSAKLRFCLVLKDNAAKVSEYLRDPKSFVMPSEYRLMKMEEFRKGKKAKVSMFFIKKRWDMSGKNVSEAFPDVNQLSGQRQIILRFNNKGAKHFAKLTSDNIGRQLAIVLDNKLYSAPTIQTAITGGSAEISGKFSQEECKAISDALVSGSLPFEIKVEAIFNTDPTLGKANVVNGIWAGIIALIVVVLFISIYYLRAGLVAIFALAVNVILVLGALAAFDATLTLPGIAGIILTMGMAVDANVLIFERIREELNKGKNLSTAIAQGYQHAFVTIIDANLTTLFTALILMKVGTGPVKGFAVTLSIGIFTSVFTALFLTRLIFDYFERFFKFKTMTMCSWLKDPKLDFLGKRKIAFGISATLIVFSLVFCLTKGSNMLGIDFTGGTQFTFSYEDRVPIQDIRDTLKQQGYDAKVTYKTSLGAQADNKKLEILIRKNIKIEDNKGEKIVSPKEKIGALLNAKFTKAKFAGGHESSLGGLVGWEFSKSAIYAIVLAFLGIILYISIRFEFAYAIASIIALMHDVIIATGIFVLCGNEVSLPVVAALLTIIGYSLNDTIVVFDRIREGLTLNPDMHYKKVINMSINKTLSRTILTSLTTLLVLIILFFFGGIAINDFVLVMLLGVIIGTYSSIFVASPIVAYWHKKIGMRAKDGELIKVEQ
ncbi:MAG: protein translocase subunit SecD [Victivallales bacterium]|nr:protein translocase subunit SecD [Victivallales bacterium]